MAKSKLTMSELRAIAIAKSKEGKLRPIQARPARIPEEKLKKFDRIYLEQERTKKELEIG